MSDASAQAPRSLADDLRSRDDVALAALLKARPDLLAPVPTDLGKLAARATSAASVVRALDQLDRFTLQVVDVLAALPDPTTNSAVTRWLGADPSAPLERLRLHGLVWGPSDGLRLVRSARQLLGAPAGLGPPLQDALGGYPPRRLFQLLADAGLPPTGDPAGATRALGEHLAHADVVDALLATAPDEAREALDRLARAGSYGRIGDAHREVSVASAQSPVEWLLARGLLVATAADAVAVPREIGIVLRGGRVHSSPEPEPPQLDVRARDAALVDRTAGGAALAFVGHTEELLENWGGAAPPVLRAGGLGVRELRRAAAVMDVEEWQAALVVEIAYASGLLARGSTAGEEWWPTSAYDRWRAAHPAHRWSQLAAAWLDSTRVVGLIGQRDEKDRVRVALGPDLTRPVAAEIRRDALVELAGLTPGQVPTAASLDARLQWRRPRRGGRLRADLVAWALREAELLGITGLGAVSAPGRALLDGDRAAAEAALAPLLPRPVDHVLLQADLTAVAPGPLEAGLAQDLALMAEVDSKGGATVYRFTHSSIRRALDAGRSGRDLQDLLATHSRTPVPQPLGYLIDDVARRHGRIRVGSARSFVRCDDEAVLSQIVADRRSGPLLLRRLAPTVLAAQAGVELTLDKLREMGYAPVAESRTGEVVVRRPDSRRTTVNPPPPARHGELPAPDERLLSAAVRALRAGERTSSFARPPSAVSASDLVPPSRPAQTLGALQSAVSSGTPLWIGYINDAGQASERVIEPIAVRGGYVTAFDHRHGAVQTFAVHRITGVAPAAAVSDS